MPEMTRERLDSALEAQLLGRIALMTAAGFTIRDITQRLRMDMNLDIEESFVQILQVELGLVKNTARVEVQRRLLAEGLSPDDASRLAGLIWDFPAKAGIQMAERGIPCRAILRDLPRTTGQGVRAGYELFKVLKEGQKASFKALKRLMLRAKVNENDLKKLIPEAASRARGLSMQINLPRGFRLISSRPEESVS